MKVINKFWKNSNTNQLLKSVEITETKIQGLPIRWYDANGNSAGENLTPKGFVEIKEKKFKQWKKNSI